MINRPRGVTLLEYLGAAAILGTAAIMLLQLIAWTNAGRRALDEQRLAWQEASNCLTLLSAEGYAALTPERAAQCALSEAARRKLPEAKLNVAIEPVSEPTHAKRIVVEISWQPRLGNSSAPVRLTTFVYEPDSKPERIEPRIEEGRPS
jgi:hypothetical protein